MSEIAKRDELIALVKTWNEAEHAFYAITTSLDTNRPQIGSPEWNEASGNTMRAWTAVSQFLKKMEVKP